MEMKQRGRVSSGYIYATVFFVGAFCFKIDFFSVHCCARKKNRNRKLDFKIKKQK